jgi:cytoskeletal protein RodZ
MGYDWEKLYEGPRFEKRAKRRKINRILNILIAVVFILIIFFGGRLLFGKGDSTETATPEISNNTDVTEVAENEESEETEKTEDTSENTNSDQNENSEETAESNKQVTPESNEEATVTDGDPETNILRTIENPAWKPIGTNQVDPQTNVYDKGTENRNEIETAASYATGLDRANMTVWWLTNNGPDKAKVTIASKDGSQNFRVYIDWVNGEGWKPVLVEELKENDSPVYQKNKTSEETEDEN